jgi:hypothetical protein
MQLPRAALSTTRQRIFFPKTFIRSMSLEDRICSESITALAAELIELVDRLHRPLLLAAIAIQAALPITRSANGNWRLR